MARWRYVKDDYYKLIGWSVWPGKAVDDKAAKAAVAKDGDVLSPTALAAILASVADDGRIADEAERREREVLRLMGYNETATSQQAPPMRAQAGAASAA